MAPAVPWQKKQLDKLVFSPHIMAMFVRKVKKPNSRISVRVVRNDREGSGARSKVRQKTICCVGHCHKEDHEQIDFLYEVGNNIIRDILNKGQKEFPGLQSNGRGKGGSKKPSSSKGLPSSKSQPFQQMVHAPSLKEKRRRETGISDIFGGIYDSLDMPGCFKGGYKKKEVCRLLKEIVLHRLDQALSKRGSVLEIRDRGEDFSFIQLDRVYRMMDKVYESREALKARVCSRTLSLFKEQVDVVFFDVTTLYFESFREDDLRRCGFSKDNKVKETQVVLALMTSREGLPVGYELYPGSVFEGKVLLQTIDSVSKSYDIRDMFLAADRGMFSRGNLLELEKKGVQFVVGARLKSLRGDLKKRILEEAPAFSRKGGFRKARSWTGEFEWEGFRLIAHYDRERAEKDRKDREKALIKIKAKLKGGQASWRDLVSNRGVRKYLKRKEKGRGRGRGKGSEDIAVLDEEKIKADRLWDGLSAVVSSSGKLKAQDILSKYRGLWQIEAAFRLNKHDLKMRPIYHWTPKRIKAHILICFIAYGLAVFARHHLKRSNINLSFERLRSELKKVQVSLVQDGSTGRQFLLPSHISETGKAIYKAFGASFPKSVKFL